MAAATNLVLADPGHRGLPWTIPPLPVLTFGIALAFPVLTLAMLDLFPNSRGSASSIQNFLALMGNALISAVVAPMLGVDLVWLATGSLVLLVCSALLWMRHLSVAPSVPQGPTDAVAYEPIDEI